MFKQKRCISTEQEVMIVCNCISVLLCICIWFIALIKVMRFTAKIDCHNSNKRNTTVYLQYYLGIDPVLRLHTMSEATLIQNTVESSDIEVVAETSCTNQN